MPEEKQPTVLSSFIPEKVQTWLMSQGVVTVLLFTLVVLCWRAAPYVADTIGGHINTITSANEKNLKSVIDAFEKDQERDQKMHERKDELLRELLQRNGFAGELTPAEDLP